MDNPFKKILNMTEKKPKTPSPAEADHTAEMPENPVETTQSIPESPENDPRLTEIQQQLDEARNKFLYLSADFDNYKRHAARERMELIQTAGRDILTALLPILDDFDRAAKNAGLEEGATLIHQKLVNTLKTRGLTKIETRPGDDFDADRHEAIAEIPAPNDELKGKIVDIVEPGYQLGERIIRFAKVVVGK